MVSIVTKENPKQLFIKIILTALTAGRNGIRSPVGSWDVSLVEIGPGAHSMDTVGGGGRSSMLKRPVHKFGKSPPSSVEFKNEWRFISTPLCAFMMWVKDRFTFTAATCFGLTSPDSNSVQFCTKCIKILGNSCLRLKDLCPLSSNPYIRSSSFTRSVLFYLEDGISNFLRNIGA